MPDSLVDSLILDLLEWLTRQDRSYEEVMDAWRTSCPRLPVWEDANDRGLLILDAHHGRSIVRLSPAGLAFLEQYRASKKEGEEIRVLAA